MPRIGFILAVHELRYASLLDISRFVVAVIDYVRH